MASTCSNSDFGQSSADPETVRKLQEQLSLRNNVDGQAMASTQCSPIENILRETFLCHARKQNGKQKRGRHDIASPPSSGSSQAPAKPKGRANVVIDVALDEDLSDDRQRDSPMAISSDDKSTGQEDSPTSASNPDTAAGGGGAVASPSVGTSAAAPSPKPKRKRVRKSKKPPTYTFQANPANFKEKVQELTGQRSAPINLEAAQSGEMCVQLGVQMQLVRPEPVRHIASKMELDTEGFPMQFSSSSVEHECPPLSSTTLEGAELALDQRSDWDGGSGTSLLNSTFSYSEDAPSWILDDMDQDQLTMGGGFQELLSSEGCSSDGYHSPMDVKPTLPLPGEQQASSGADMFEFESFLESWEPQPELRRAHESELHV